MLIKILELSFIGILLLIAFTLNVTYIIKCIKDKSILEVFVHIGLMIALLLLTAILVVSYVI